MATVTPFSDRGSKQLTDKERVFVDQYLVDLDVRKAAIRSGYSAKSAGSTGNQIVNRSHVKKAIGKALLDMRLDTRVTIDTVLDQLDAILTRSIHQFVNMKDGTALGLHEIDERAAACVDGFEQEITDFTNEYGTTRTIKNKIKLVGKAGAIDMAMKYRGLFTKDNEQKQNHVTLDFSKLFQPHLESNDPVTEAMKNLEETTANKVTIEVEPITKKPKVKNKPTTKK